MHSIPMFDLPEPEAAFTGEPTGRRSGARAARFRRVHQGVDRLLCSAHMTLARQLEGLDPMDDANGTLT